MLKAYKYRISPKRETANKLQRVLNRCRELYNAALQERKEAYTYAGKTIGVYEQKRDLVDIKRLREEYQDIGSHVLQDVLFRLEKAMQAFFRCVKAGEKAGYPRFMGPNRYDSFCYPDRAGYCSYKAVSAGREVVKVNPRYTSQACSGCGQVRKKELSERWHSCDCGTELDRDQNAAINILRLGRSQQSAMAVEAPGL